MLHARTRSTVTFSGHNVWSDLSVALSCLKNCSSCSSFFNAASAAAPRFAHWRRAFSLAAWRFWVASTFASHSNASAVSASVVLHASSPTAAWSIQAKSAYPHQHVHPTAQGCQRYQLLLKVLPLRVQLRC